MIQTRLKVLLVIVPSLCLAIFTGKLCAWNGTSLLSPNHHDYHLDTAENDSSSSFYYGGDEMPDMWQKPRGGFAGTLGEMLITLSLFNQMDREAAKDLSRNNFPVLHEDSLRSQGKVSGKSGSYLRTVPKQKFHIISWPVSDGKNEQEISEGNKDNEEKSAQTAASFEYSADRKTIIRKPDEEQPPDDDQDHHTHIGEGNHCYASGCNGGRCQCNECSTSPAERPATKERKVDESTDEAKDQPVANVLQQLRQREMGGTPLSASLLASLSQERLSSGIHNPAYTYGINEYAFNNIRVLPDGRIVSCWGDPGALIVWSPQALMPQDHSYAEFYTNPGGDTYHLGVYEVASMVFFTDIDTRENALPRPVSNSHFASLPGHTAEICGMFVKRDGRIVTWSKDQTFRIWTEHNGHWSSVKIELNRKVYYGWRIDELSDGRLRFYSPFDPYQTTLILSEHEYGWEYEAINGLVEELRDGRLYQLDSDGLRIWHQNSDENPTYLRSDLPLCIFSDVHLQLDDGRIITQTIESGLSGDSSIRLWTEQRNRTWTSRLLGKYSPRRIIPINNRRILLYGADYFVVISKVGDQWVPSDRTSIPMDYEHAHIDVLGNGLIVATGDTFRDPCLRAMIWTEHQNQWYPGSLIDENGTPVAFDRVTLLRDGRWVSWSKCDCHKFSREIRIWSYTDNRYSSTVLSNVSGIDQILELPGGWLAAVSRSFYSSTLKVWTLYPAQDKPHN